MSSKYCYVGCFVPSTALFERVPDGGRLSRVISDPHVTIVYEPEEVDETLFGEPITVEVYAYANDGKNEGVKVRLSSENVTLRAAIERISVPHITLSVSGDGQAVDTGALSFTPITPFRLVGVYGGVNADKQVITKPPKRDYT